jgi:enoyl-[acyl-carrier protein] reductase/trans-2-enoyl-CoA reductase (NAD+)
MKSNGTHEGCIEQTTRLFLERLFTGDINDLALDEKGRIRLDDWELTPEVQDQVKALWHTVSEENLNEISDFAGYQAAYLQMHGFGFGEVDYEAEVDQVVEMSLAFGD